jgi:hypothetical protein
MVTRKVTMYLLEKDHRLDEYCEELGTSANGLTNEQFISAAKEIGWVMSLKEYERLHNTGGMPRQYYLRQEIEEDVSAKRVI